MHRRGVGAGAIAKKKLAEAKYKERGTVLAEDQLAQMSKQLDMFKTNLEEFASKHKQEIRKNPEFRVQFQDMCATIGVDPLACKLSVGVQCSSRVAKGQSSPSCCHYCWGVFYKGLQGDPEDVVFRESLAGWLSIQFDGKDGEVGVQAE
uniref:Vacuolar-sorting protein SNF8 n=2 Tax=Monodon monoceros TaxID=40151 RepID=A0A8C6CE49_MONMO